MLKCRFMYKKQALWVNAWVLSVLLVVGTLARAHQRQPQNVQHSALSSLAWHSPPSRCLIRRGPNGRKGCLKATNMDEFSIPGEPQLLWAPDSELAFKCESFVNFTDATLEEVGDAAESEPLSTAGRDSQGRRGGTAVLGMIAP